MQPDQPTSSGFYFTDTGGDGPAVAPLHGVLMPPVHATRLAEHFENSQLVWIDDCLPLVPID